MPESLLASQLATLEPPGADEPTCIALGIERPADEVIVAVAARALREA
jgi:gluconate kinase